MDMAVKETIGIPAIDRAIGRRGDCLAMVLSAVRADPGRRRHRLRGGCRDPLAGRHGVAGNALAAAAAAFRPGAGRQRLDRDIRGADDRLARRDVPHDLAKPQLSAEVAAKLALAWLVIRLVTSVIRNAFIVKLVSVSAWLVAALSILGQLDPAVDRSIGFDRVGGLRLTPLLLIKLGALLIVALWLTNIASNFAESRITRSSDLTPSIQVLLVKMIRHRPDGVRDRDRARARSASTSRRSRSFPARPASASVSACRRSSPISSAASSCWRTNR